MSPEMAFYIAPISAVIALLMAIFLYKKMVAAPKGNDTMEGIAADVRDGANAYLFRQYKVVSLAFIILFVLMAVLAAFHIQNAFVPVAFLTGGFFSGLCGYIGMKTATLASSRTAQGCRTSLNQGLQVSFKAGSVMGMVIVGFGLLDIALWYLLLDKVIFTAGNIQTGLAIGPFEFVGQHADYVTEKIKGVLELTDVGTQYKMTHITTTMLTFGMGASLQALFARLGGGIFTKAADVGADLVGKVEAGIPEDDPRNPATIADNVGDNVGDVAGMGADLYESYCGSILATAALGAALGPAFLKATGINAVGAVTAPMVVAGLGIILSIVGIFMVRTKEEASQKTLLRSLLIGTGGASVLVLAAVAGMAAMGWITWGLFGSVCVGLLAGVIIGQITEYYTSDAYGPTKGIADQAKMGPATAIIEGISVGLLSNGYTVATIVAGIIGAFAFAGGFSATPGLGLSAGLYGVSFAAVGMLSTLGITMATDAYGPIADNAGGNAEMAGLPAEVRQRTDALDSLGNTTAAIGKGFAIGSAALTALALLASYLEEVRVWIGNDLTARIKVAQEDQVITPEEAGTLAVLKGDMVFFRGHIDQDLMDENGAVIVPNTRPAAVDDSSAFVTIRKGNQLIACYQRDRAPKEPTEAFAQKAAAEGLKAQALGVDFREIQHAGIADFATAYNLSIFNPLVIGGLFLGGLCAFVFSAMTMKAVGRAAGGMVEEVRRQFRDVVGIMDYVPGDMSEANQKRKPDYAQCVSIATGAAQKEMVLPALLGVVVPVAVGLVMGVAGVIGLLAGTLVTGFCLATLMNNAGGAWDNAKKSIEAGRNGGKYLKDADGNYVDAKGNRVANKADAKNPVHGAAVICDTVGDPFKDTSGPALNILIKLMTVVSVVFSGLVVICGLM